jgi:hypothetical protein
LSPSRHRLKFTFIKVWKDSTALVRRIDLNDISKFFAIFAFPELAEGLLACPS